MGIGKRIADFFGCCMANFIVNADHITAVQH